MTPRRLVGGASAAVASSRLGGTPGSSRVRSWLIWVQDSPPSVVLNRNWLLKYSAFGAAVENTSGTVHVWRAGSVMFRSGEMFFVSPVRTLQRETVPPNRISGCSGSGAV